MPLSNSNNVTREKEYGRQYADFRLKSSQYMRKKMLQKQPTRSKTQREIIKRRHYGFHYGQATASANIPKYEDAAIVTYRNRGLSEKKITTDKAQRKNTGSRGYRFSHKKAVFSTARKVSKAVFSTARKVSENFQFEDEEHYLKHITGIPVKTAAKAGKEVAVRSYKLAALPFRSISRRLSAMVIKQTAKLVVKASQKIIQLVTELAVKSVSAAIAAFGVAGTIVLLIVMLIMIVAGVVMNDIGWWSGEGTYENAQYNFRLKAAIEYVGSLNTSYVQHIRDEYGEDIEIDDSFVSNINDILVIYVAQYFNFERGGSETLSMQDKEEIRAIYDKMVEKEVISHEEAAGSGSVESSSSDDGYIVESTITVIDKVVIIRRDIPWALEHLNWDDEQRMVFDLVCELSEDRISAGGIRMDAVASNNKDSAMDAGYCPDLGMYLTWPTLNNYITSPFADMEDRNSGHKGIDIAPVASGVAGDNIFAAADGKVVTAAPSSTAGNYIVIDHGNGVVTRYLHMTDYIVHVGDEVKAGQCIGHMGTTGDSTGVHLHFDLSVNGQYCNPMNYFK